MLNISHLVVVVGLRQCHHIINFPFCRWAWKHLLKESINAFNALGCLLQSWYPFQWWRPILINLLNCCYDAASEREPVDFYCLGPTLLSLHRNLIIRKVTSIMTIYLSPHFASVSIYLSPHFASVSYPQHQHRDRHKTPNSFYSLRSGLQHRSPSLDHRRQTPTK